MWFDSLYLSLEVAAIATSILLVSGLPFTYLIFTARPSVRILCESILFLPLVLPPTVMGYYLLALLSPDNLFRSFFSWLPFELVAFSFEGIVLGSILFSLPFVWQTLISGYEKVPSEAFVVSEIYNLPRFKFWWLFVLPQIRTHILLAGTFGFAHSLGEFGVIILIGGAIPGETLTAAVELYQLIHAFEEDKAQKLALILLGLAFALILSVNYLKAKIRHHVTM